MEMFVRYGFCIGGPSNTATLPLKYFRAFTIGFSLFIQFTTSSFVLDEFTVPSVILQILEMKMDSFMRVS